MARLATTECPPRLGDGGEAALDCVPFWGGTTGGRGVCGASDDSGDGFVTSAGRVGTGRGGGGGGISTSSSSSSSWYKIRKERQVKMDNQQSLHRGSCPHRFRTPRCLPGCESAVAKLSLAWSFPVYLRRLIHRNLLVLLCSRPYIPFSAFPECDIKGIAPRQ